MTTSTEVLKPVKGMRFRHASKRRRYHFGEGEAPLLEMTVTAVQRGIVHCKDSDYNRYRLPLATFDQQVDEVLSLPVPPVKMSDAEFEALHRKAHEAGHAAATAARPTPMVVQQHESPFDDNSEVVQQWYVPEGVCGFAWVLTPGNTPFARWAKRRGLFTRSYGGGLMNWVSGYGQSMDRKEAYAGAYAAVLTEAGITAHAGSRMD